jgi:hypothetical protein
LDRGKNTLKNAFWGLLVLGVFSVVLVPAAVQALTLIPPSMEFQVSPGERYTTSVKLHNETQNALTLYTEVAPFTAEGETGDPAFNFDAPAADLTKWIEIQAGPIVLEPGARAEIPVAVNVPADAEPGGHYAGIFFSTQPPEAEEGGQIGIGTKLGTLVLASVEGDVVEAGQIAQFGLAEGTSIGRLPATFFTRFENTGNVHLRPTGTITVQNMLGSTAAQLEVNPGGGATLPETVRRYESVWEKAQVQEAAGGAWTRFRMELANERKNFAFGKYTATLALTAGSVNQISGSAQISFWVVPWRVLTVSGIALALLIILVVLLVKRYNSWVIKRAQIQK